MQSSVTIKYFFMRAEARTKGNFQMLDRFIRRLSLNVYSAKKSLLERFSGTEFYYCLQQNLHVGECDSELLSG